MNPTNITVNSTTKNLTIHFENNETFSIPAEFLRVYSPSAEVRGHGNQPPKLIYGRKHVNIISAEMVGKYAIRLKFDDLHDSGIYSWETLYDLGKNYHAYWDMYIKRLTSENKSREP